MKSGANSFPNASQSFFLTASHPAFSLAMMSASDGPVDFISPALFAFEVIFVFPGGAVQAIAKIKSGTRAKIFFISEPPWLKLLERGVVSIAKCHISQGYLDHSDKKGTFIPCLYPNRYWCSLKTWHGSRP